MNDDDEIQAFIDIHGVTKLPPGTADGLDRPIPLRIRHIETAPTYNNHKSPQQRLAIAILATMLENLTGKTREREQPKIRRDDAYRWFFVRNRDFDELCDLAGYDPSYVRLKAKNVYEHGLPKLTTSARAKPSRTEYLRNYMRKYRKRKKNEPLGNYAND